MIGNQSFFAQDLTVLLGSHIGKTSIEKKRPFKTTFKRVFRNQIPIENDEYDGDNGDNFDDDIALKSSTMTTIELWSKYTPFK